MMRKSKRRKSLNLSLNLKKRNSKKIKRMKMPLRFLRMISMSLPMRKGTKWD